MVLEGEVSLSMVIKCVTSKVAVAIWWIEMTPLSSPTAMMNDPLYMVDRKSIAETAEVRRTVALQAKVSSDFCQTLTDLSRHAVAKTWFVVVGAQAAHRIILEWPLGSEVNFVNVVRSESLRLKIAHWRSRPTLRR